MHRLQMFRPSNAAALLRRNITSLPMHRSTPHTAAALSTTTNLSQISNTRVAAQRAQALARWFTVGNGRAKMSTLHGTAASTEEQQADVIQRKHLGSRTFILNRPLRLNSLNLSMIRNITPQLQAWDKSDLAKVIIIKGTGHRAFCAGGDVREIIKLLDERAPETLEFFEEEYQLNHLIATLGTPLVAIMDGVTMGGGVGLSVHAPFRIATENTVFAMPETAIGLFPDVGGSFFLSRMDGEVGTYLALTGEKLKGSDVLRTESDLRPCVIMNSPFWRADHGLRLTIRSPPSHAGIATHYVPSSRLQALEDRLAELETSDNEVINMAIEEFVGEFDPHYKYPLSGNVRRSIDRCFRGDTIGEIVEALKEDKFEWAKVTLETLMKMSPTSLTVTLQQIRKGADMTISECFRMEFNLNFWQRVVFTSHNPFIIPSRSTLQVSPDFREGVTSLLVNKPATTPTWNPPTLSEISDTDVLNSYFFAPSPNELSLLTSKDLSTLHSRYALPTEKDIERVVTGEVKGWFSRDRRGKQGVREKVVEVLERRTTIIAADGLKAAIVTDPSPTQ
ncbi:ClpP/crotonase-like domain-containing protein, partial [Jimgerdemannia flammicorona]